MSGKHRLIATRTLDVLYGRMEQAIVRNDATGRHILISEGWGGVDGIEGGAYRYSHGWAADIGSVESFGDLELGSTELQSGDDNLHWDGRAVSRVAESVGL